MLGIGLLRLSYHRPDTCIKPSLFTIRTTQTYRAWSTTSASFTPTPRTPSAATSARQSSRPRSPWGSTCSRTIRSSTSEGERVRTLEGPENQYQETGVYNARPIATTLSNSDCCKCIVNLPRYILWFGAWLQELALLSAPASVMDCLILTYIYLSSIYLYLFYCIFTQEVQLYHDFLMILQLFRSSRSQVQPFSIL